MGRFRHEGYEPLSGLVGSLGPAEFETLFDVVEERRRREELGFGALSEACRAAQVGSGLPWMRLGARPEGPLRSIRCAEVEAPVMWGRVWVDEMYVDYTDPPKVGRSKKLGFFKDKLCIAAGIDARKERVAVVCGHGKSTTARISATLAHDRERAHGVLVGEKSLEGKSYKADVRDPSHLGAMARVNNLCS